MALFNFSNKKRPRTIVSWFRWGFRFSLRWPFRVSSSTERVVRGTANPTWGDIFECCLKTQSSKLEHLFSLKCGKRDVRALSLEISKMSSQVGLTIQPSFQFQWDILPERLWGSCLSIDLVCCGNIWKETHKLFDPDKLSVENSWSIFRVNPQTQNSNLRAWVFFEYQTSYWLDWDWEIVSHDCPLNKDGSLYFPRWFCFICME